MPKDDDKKSPEMFPTLGSETKEPDKGSDDEFLPGFKTREDAEKGIGEMKAAQDKLNAELGQMRAQGETMQGMMDQLLAGQSPATVAAPAAPTLDYTKLPDPVEDKDGFARGVLEQTQAIVAHQTQEASKEAGVANSLQQQLDSLWGKFQDDYEDLADYPEYVEVAAREEVSKANARGISSDQLIRRNSDSFMKSVAANVRQKVEKLTERLGHKKKPEDEGRDEGLSGGSHEIPSGAEDGAGKLGSMTQDIKNLQKDSGFF